MDEGETAFALDEGGLTPLNFCLVAGNLARPTDEEGAVGCVQLLLESRPANAFPKLDEMSAGAVAHAFQWAAYQGAFR